MTTEDRLERQGKYKQVVAEAIAAVAKAFRERPESFLYEADVQCRFVSELATRLTDFPATGRPKGVEDWSFVTSTRSLKVNPVKAEYPDSVWFDIALLDHELIEDENLWNQPVAVAIELKLRQANGGKQDFFADRGKLDGHLQGARSKGPKREFAGVALVFCHKSLGNLAKDWEAAGCVVNPEGFQLAWDKVSTWAISP